MSTKTVISKGYRVRLGVIGLALVGWGCWSLYDGIVVYPEKQKMYQTYMQIQEQHKDNWDEKWQQVTAENHWDPGQPSAKSDLDILMQYVMAGLTLPFGLYFSGLFMLAGRRFVLADDAGLHTNYVAEVPWDQIKSVDTTRWRSKGIALVQYEGPQGSGAVLLDDWKFEQQTTQNIFEMVADRTGLVELMEDDEDEEAGEDSQA